MKILQSPEPDPKFISEVESLKQLHNITETHAGCYISNYYDDYICTEYNGGCKFRDDCYKISQGVVS